MRYRPCQSVQPGANQYVTFPDVLQRRRQLGPIVLLAAELLTEDPFAVAKAFELRLYGLLCSANSRVSNSHGEALSLPGLGELPLRLVRSSRIEQLRIEVRRATEGRLLLLPGGGQTGI